MKKTLINKNEGLGHAPRGFPELLKDLPELTQWAGEDARGGWNRVRVAFSEEMG